MNRSTRENPWSGQHVGAIDWLFEDNPFIRWQVLATSSGPVQRVMSTLDV